MVSVSSPVATQILHAVGIALAAKIRGLDQVAVAVTPGVGYGQSGEGYVRLSLTIPDVSLVKGLSRLAGWRNTRHLTLKKTT